ncbi:MAG: hypothetical protein IKK33_15980 [Lachnospiraceae bacterium]|nr:hypothetical protein [Lachnospiraceae bacterium]
MKKKKILISVIVIIMLLVGTVLFMNPRIKLYNAARELTETGFPKVSHCEYFNHFDVTYASDQPVQTISHDGLSIDIPADWMILENSLENSLTYESPDKSQRILLSEASDLTGYSLFNEEQVAELTADLSYTVGLKRLEKGFDALGIPMPDSAYTTMKSTLLLERDSYSLFNADKTIAYYIVGMIKSIEPQFALNYIYETENICATYHVSPPDEEHPYRVLADVFSAKNLNRAYSLVIRTDSEESLYAMMNSIQINQE